MKKINTKDKYYLINEENFFDFHVNDIISFFDEDDELLGDAKVYEDNRGIYILKSENRFSDNKYEYYETKKYYEVGGEFETNINIKIKNLKVDFFNFSFDYELKINEKPIKSDNYYESDHSWQDEREKFYKMLKNGYAGECVLRDININY